MHDTFRETKGFIIGLFLAFLVVVGIQVSRAQYKTFPVGVPVETQALFCNALSEQLGIEYSPDHVGRIMHRLGLLPTKRKQGKL
jgi:transposase